MNRCGELVLTFAKIGAFTFGGGYAMLALLDRECVERKAWLTAEELMDVTVLAESTPGPIAINCATYTGYKQAGMAGAVAATLGIVLPSFLMLLLLSSFLEGWLSTPPVANAFRGIRVAVALLILQAGVKMSRKMLAKTPNKPLSAAFVAVFFAVVLLLNILDIHFSAILLILLAGLLGLALYARPTRPEKQEGAK